MREDRRDRIAVGSLVRTRPAALAVEDPLLPRAFATTIDVRRRQGRPAVVTASAPEADDPVGPPNHLQPKGGAVVVRAAPRRRLIRDEVRLSDRFARITYSGAIE